MFYFALSGILVATAPDLKLTPEEENNDAI